MSVRTRRTLGLLLAAFGITLTACRAGEIIATGGDATAIAGGTVFCDSTVTVASLKISPRPTTIALGATQTLTGDIGTHCAGQVTWSSDNQQIVSVGQNTGVIIGVSLGTTVIHAVISVPSGTTTKSIRDSITITVTGNSGPGNPTLTALPALLTGTFCAQGFTGTSAPQQVQLLRSIGNGTPTAVPLDSVVYSQTGSTLQVNVLTGTVSFGAVGSGSLNLSVLGSPQFVTVPVTVSNTSCTPVSGVTITVAPKLLTITIGSSAVDSAVVTGTSAVPTWVSTLGCATLAGSPALKITVTGTRACRDSLVASVGGVQDFAIVNVVSVGTICNFTAPSQTLAANQTMTITTQNGVNCTGTPWFFSKDPSVLTVVGGPTTIVIGGFTWPAGPNALIKGIRAGSTQICEQVGVTDPTLFFCLNFTVTAASGDVLGALNIMGQPEGHFEHIALKDIPRQPTPMITH